MDNNLKETLAEFISDEYLKSKIKDALAHKIIDGIKYDSDDLILECVREIMDDNFKLTLQEELKEHKEKFQEIIKSSIKDQINSLGDRIQIKMSSWDLKDIFKKSIEIKDLD